MANKYASFKKDAVKSRHQNPFKQPRRKQAQCTNCLRLQFESPLFTVKCSCGGTYQVTM